MFNLEKHVAKSLNDKDVTYKKNYVIHAYKHKSIFQSTHTQNVICGHHESVDRTRKMSQVLFVCVSFQFSWLNIPHSSFIVATIPTTTPTVSPSPSEVGFGGGNSTQTNDDAGLLHRSLYAVSIDHSQMVQL